MTREADIDKWLQVTRKANWRRQRAAEWANPDPHLLPDDNDDTPEHAVTKPP